VLWLEEYLLRWKKTLVVVSHDREFLNSVCTDIIHLHDLKLATYRGNFGSFEEMYEQRRREANRAFEKYEKQLKAAKASSSKAKIEKVQSGAKARLDKKKGGESEDEDKPEAPRKWADYSVSFAFPAPSELPPPLLSLSDVCFAYPGRDDFGLKDVNLGVDMGTRVAIVGPNGAGTPPPNPAQATHKPHFPFIISLTRFSSRQVDAAEPAGRRPAADVGGAAKVP